VFNEECFVPIIYPHNSDLLWRYSRPSKTSRRKDKWGPTQHTSETNCGNGWKDPLHNSKHYILPAAFRSSWDLTTRVLYIRVITSQTGGK
jgi:hypothetical protein